MGAPLGGDRGRPNGTVGGYCCEKWGGQPRGDQAAKGPASIQAGGPGHTTVHLGVRSWGGVRTATHRPALEGKANRAQGKHAIHKTASLRNSPKEKPVSARLHLASAQLCQPLST